MTRNEELNNDELHNIIATFIIEDLKQLGIDFKMTGEGRFEFVIQEHYEMCVERAKLMGYLIWLRNGNVID